MKFRTHTKALFDALSNVYKVIPSKPSLAALACVKIVAVGAGSKSTVSLTGTDMETMHKEWVEVGSECVGGEALVPAKDLLTVLRSYKADTPIVTIYSDDEKLYIEAGNEVFNIALNTIGEYLDEFPMLGEPVLTVGGHDLYEGFENTLFSAAKDDTRPILNGVYFAPKYGDLRMQCANRYTLAVQDVNVEEIKPHYGFVVPLDGAQYVMKFIDKKSSYEVATEERTNEYGTIKFIIFSGGKSITSIVEREGRFPDTDIIINSKNDAHINLKDVTAFYKLCERAAIPAKSDANRVNYTLNAGRLSMSVQNSEGTGYTGYMKDSEATTDYMQTVEVTLNVQYLMDMIKAVGKKTPLDMWLKSASPAHFTNNTGFRFVIMPIAK